jgi:hypothetical protein
MADPTLVVESGMTYERTEIQKWFRTNNTDPREQKIVPKHCAAARD